VTALAFGTDQVKDDVHTLQRCAQPACIVQAANSGFRPGCLWAGSGKQQRVVVKSAQVFPLRRADGSTLYRQNLCRRSPGSLQRIIADEVRFDGVACFLLPCTRLSFCTVYILEPTRALEWTSKTHR
jgi:hypothetical protein